MNALNILSGISATPPPSPPRSRTSSASNVDDVRHALRDGHSSSSLASVFPDEKTHDGQENDKPPPVPADPSTDETVALLNRYELRPEPITPEKQHWRLWRITKRVVDAVATSLKVVLATIAAPGRYVVACLYDDQGNFSAMLPVRSMFRSRRRQTGAYPPSPRQDMEEKEGYLEKPKLRPKERHRDQFPASSSANALTSDSDSEKLPSTDMEDSPARNTRSKTASATSKDKDDTAPAKRSIRIKLHSGDSLRRTRQMSKSSQSSQTQEDKVAAVANSLKSPSSPAATKLKYPRAPAAPRPLVPRRQPSYILTHSTETPKKTLIIDLDETLIHSMAKGGRMSTGHMVEVKFQGPIGGSGVVLGPQVPILYYVHERPFCHEFLRKVCKWYNLIVFTASVQEYADPVIDWLERERKYFSGRYYRQHCTFRNGAYIKDLSQVEPDLSKVMILDNSPMSYIFHEDNAIPIEGWISDPTDNDLLHLVPLLEGLQYVTDVRALLALRLGQAERA